MTTEDERRLARNALGLPNINRCSYRNRFWTSIGASNEAPWRAMVERGHALVEPQPNDRLFFALTRAGAEAALDPNERLDREDFPTPTETSDDR